MRDGEAVGFIDRGVKQDGGSLRGIKQEEDKDAAGLRFYSP